MKTCYDINFEWFFHLTQGVTAFVLLKTSWCAIFWIATMSHIWVTIPFKTFPIAPSSSFKFHIHLLIGIHSITNFSVSSMKYYDVVEALRCAMFLTYPFKTLFTCWIQYIHHVSNEPHKCSPISKGFNLVHQIAKFHEKPTKELTIFKVIIWHFQVLKKPLSHITTKYLIFWKYGCEPS